MGYKTNDMETVAASYWKPNIHHYNTPDSLATIMMLGYFNTDRNRFKLYDHIMIVANTGSAPEGHAFFVTQVKPNVLIQPMEPAPVGDVNLMSWEGTWEAGTYPKNSVVNASGWVMVANKDTNEPAAVLQQGDPFYLYTGTPTAPEAQAKQLIFGSRLTAGRTGFITGFRMDTIAGNQYDVYRVADPLGVADIQPLYSFTANSTGWREFALTPTIILEGTALDLIAMVQQPAGTPTETPLNYNYSKPNNLTPPTAGQITQSNRETSLMLISDTDSDLNDQTAFLDTLTIGDKISLENGIDWAVQSITKETNYYTVGVAPATQAALTGVQSFIFETVPEATITYATDTNYWATSEINGQGLLGQDIVYAEIVPDDNFYGIDLQVQEATIPVDWDYFTGGDV